MCPIEEDKAEADITPDEEEDTPEAIKDLEKEVKAFIEEDDSEEEVEGVEEVSDIPRGQESKYGI